MRPDVVFRSDQDYGVFTYRVWLRHELFRGRLSPIQFQFSEQKLGEFIKARSNAKPHLAEMVI